MKTPFLLAVMNVSAAHGRHAGGSTRWLRGVGVGCGQSAALSAWGLALCMLAALVPPSAHAQDSTVGFQDQIQALLRQQTPPVSSKPGEATAKPWRMAFELGQLDPRLKLAPCDKVRTYVPDGAPLWGKTRVGLKCEQGPVKWNVYWPVTVQVWGQALVPVTPLRPGTLVGVDDVRLAEVDLAASPSPALVRPADIVGRTVMRSIEPGHSIRQDDVKARRWFAAGDTVRLTVVGAGFQVGSEGTAVSHGDEGHCARIRTDNGHIVCGMPVGDRQAELAL